jgi:lipoprotein NlpD
LSAPAPITGGNKNAPRGDKRPYSDATLAEMQKSESASEKPTEAVTAATATPADEDAVSWMWPADGKVVATFDDSKKGIDIAGKSGQPVLAAGSGKVMYAGSGIRGYGNLVIVKHTSTLLSAYAHNKTISVKEGQTVTKGQKIAEMGDSDADAVKLHFEIRQQGKPVDPSKFLPSRQ